MRIKLRKKHSSMFARFGFHYLFANHKDKYPTGYKINKWMGDE